MTQSYQNIEYKGKTVFAKAIMSDFRRIPKYFSAEEACFMVLTKGSFLLRTPDKVLEFQQGEGLLAKCGNYFVERTGTKPVANNEPVLEVLAAYFHPEIVKPFFPGDLTFSNFKPDFDASKLPMNELLKTFMDSIHFLLENPAACSDDLTVLKLKELLLLLAKTDNAPNIHAFIVSLFKPFEYDFREIVQKNALSNLSLAEMARLCHMSLATFKRRFAEIFEESPAQFLMNEKLNKAAETLALPEKGILDVVFECGFESASHFSKAFKRKFGVSPTAFRLNHLENSLSR